MFVYFKILFLTLSFLVVSRMEMVGADVPIDPYGGEDGRRIFAERSQRVVGLAVRHIERLKEFAERTGKPLSSLHKVFLGDKDAKKDTQRGLAYQRYLIARDTDTKGAEEFGKLRAKDATKNLWLTKVIDSWKESFLATYGPVLKEVKSHLKEGETLQIQGSNGSFCLIDVLDPSGFASPPQPSYGSVERVNAYSLEHETMKYLFGCCSLGAENIENTRKLQSLNRIRVLTVMLGAQSEGRDVNLTQYYTWIEVDPDSPTILTDENIGKIGAFSGCVARHTAPADIHILMAEADKAWAHAITLKDASVDTVTEALGTYIWWMAHAMYFDRGTAAVVKDFGIPAICQGYALEFIYPGSQPDQDAMLFYSLTEYQKFLKNNMTLRPLEKAEDLRLRG